VQDLAADLDRLGVDENESDFAGFGAAIDPVVDRAALHDNVARFKMDDGVVHLHVDLARHDDGIIDGIRPVNPRRDTGQELDDAKDRAVLQRRADLSFSPVLVARVVDGKRFRGPDHTSRPSRPAGRRILCNLVDLDHRTPVGVMAGDYAS